MSKDSEWMNILLCEHKLAASMLTSCVMESADPQVRQHFSSLLSKSLDHQKQIFDMMNQKGWYKVAPAPQDELSRIQQSFSMMQQQVYDHYNLLLTQGRLVVGPVFYCLSFPS